MTKEVVLNYMRRENEEEIKVMEKIKESVLDPKDPMKMLVRVATQTWVKDKLFFELNIEHEDFYQNKQFFMKDEEVKEEHEKCVTNIRAAINF